MTDTTDNGKGGFSEEMRGTLWKNEGEKKDRAPDYTGTAIISGLKVRSVPSKMASDGMAFGTLPASK